MSARKNERLFTESISAMPTLHSLARTRAWSASPSSQFMIRWASQRAAWEADRAIPWRWRLARTACTWSTWAGSCASAPIWCRCCWRQSQIQIVCFQYLHHCPLHHHSGKSTYLSVAKRVFSDRVPLASRNWHNQRRRKRGWMGEDSLASSDLKEIQSGTTWRKIWIFKHHLLASWRCFEELAATAEPTETWRPKSFSRGIEGLGRVDWVVELLWASPPKIARQSATFEQRSLAIFQKSTLLKLRYHVKVWNQSR